MSNLIKPYEISVWEDVWSTSEKKFVEKRLGIIGTQEMDTPGRALNPILTKNVNGVKKLTFNMYKRYVDTTTGEKVENPFSEWLISERKIKLKYEKDEDGNDIWYDFIIKDVVENSSTYLYSYSLEDALVQELSKNGFGVVLDEKVGERGKNTGTAKELAEYVLQDTDWKVESEKFIQTIEESLIYLTAPSITNAILCQEPSSFSEALTEIPNQTIPTTDTILGFYSCCNNRPHRFQFIVLKDAGKGKVSVDENRCIHNNNNQYYIEIESPNDYKKVEDKTCGLTLYLPNGWQICAQSNDVIADDHDTTLSTWYRGKRYGFAQQVEYIPLLERYCNKYTKVEENYYGYVDNQYISPTLIKNVVTSADFKDTSGWLGTYVGNTPNVKKQFGATVESVCGRFGTIGDAKEGTKYFYSLIDDLSTGLYSEERDYKSYLKFSYPETSTSDYGVIINSGFNDNVSFIKNVEPGEEWLLRVKIVDSAGKTVDLQEEEKFEFFLSEVSYEKNKNNYSVGSGDGVLNAKVDGGFKKIEGTSICEAKLVFDVPTKLSDIAFSKRNIRLVIKNKTGNSNYYYYLEKIELFKKVLNNNNQVIAPDTLDTEGVVLRTYYYFHENELSEKTKKDDIEYVKENSLNYSIYKPVYNAGGEKVRTVNEKESNYFNILQSIAETFEAWLSFDIVRDSNTGAILEKRVKFSNYAGQTNYASFRYGVNLKDIQRTHGSKNIVTKLIVKDNSNELAESGFCTIKRAGSNPTGENYIYDFQYYQNMGLMDSKDYLNTLYSTTGAIGQDVNVSGETNINGYFPRIKSINNQLISLNEEANNLRLDLKELQAKIKVEEGLLDAATSGLEEAREDFYALTNVYPETMSSADYEQIYCGQVSADGKFESTSTFEYTDEPTIKKYGGAVVMTPIQKGSPNSTNWEFQVDIQFNEGEYKDQGYSLESYGQLSYLTDKTDYYFYGALSRGRGSGQNYGKDPWAGIKIKLNEDYQDGCFYKLSYIFTIPTSVGEEDLTKVIGGHCASFSKTQLIIRDNDDNDKILDQILDSDRLSYAFEAGKNYKIEFSGIYKKNPEDGNPYLFIQPDRGLCGSEKNQTFCEIRNLTVSQSTTSFNKEKTFSAFVYFQGKQTVTTSPQIFYNEPTVPYYKGDQWYKLREDMLNKDEDVLNNDQDVLNEDEEESYYTIYYAQVDRTEGEYNADEWKEDELFVEPEVITYYSTFAGAREIVCKISPYTLHGSTDYSLDIVDTSSGKPLSLLTQYQEYQAQIKDSTEKLGSADQNDTLYHAKGKKETEIQEKTKKINTFLGYKEVLNKKFFKHYSRFIQEGTWISEEYVDDDKYYVDAQSVLYNSCYPQVAYSINVLALSGQEGYELFTYGLGDKTYVEDDEFFGEGKKEEVVITEMSEALNDPSKNTIKVQNFKNQFQDLFQKITATVQQTEYSTGAYQKAVALAEASAQQKSEFLNAALGVAENELSIAGQQTVIQDASGITVIDDSTNNKLRLIGGAILMGTHNEESGEFSWKTGITPKGISASLLTAGKVNTGEILIGDPNEPAFRWDSYGISAFDVDWNSGLLGRPNTSKFVRFDKYGIYGIDGTANGMAWKPSGLEEIDDKATFALTWEGLKVIGDGGITARIGYNNNVVDEDGNVITYGKILDISDNDEKSLMSFSNEGVLKIGGWAVDQEGLVSIEEPSAQTYSLLRNGARTSDLPDVPNQFLRSTPFELSVAPWKGKNEEGNEITANIVFKAGENFLVSQEGCLYTNDLQAIGGKIGGWGIEADCLSYNNQENGDSSIFSSKSIIMEQVITLNKDKNYEFATKDIEIVLEHYRGDTYVYCKDFIYFTAESLGLTKIFVPESWNEIASGSDDDYTMYNTYEIVKSLSVTTKEGSYAYENLANLQDPIYIYVYVPKNDELPYKLSNGYSEGFEFCLKNRNLDGEEVTGCYMTYELDIVGIEQFCNISSDKTYFRGLEVTNTHTIINNGLQVYDTIFKQYLNGRSCSIEIGGKKYRFVNGILIE